MGLTVVCLDTVLRVRSRRVGSDCFTLGSSSIVRPRTSDCSFGKATYIDRQETRETGTKQSQPTVEDLLSNNIWADYTATKGNIRQGQVERERERGKKEKKRV